MKNIKINLLTIIIIGACSWSCNDLNIEPVNVLNGNQIYTNENGVNVAIATLYARLPIATQNASVYGLRGDGGAPFSNWNNSSMLTGEGQCSPLRVAMAPKSFTGGMLGWWSYGDIRYTNLAIKELIANESSFVSKPEAYKHWLGEAYFCRAFMYFYMARIYGGIPIVKDVKSYLGMAEEELYIPRNTEKEVLDFIGEDLDKAIDLMGDKPLQVGRADRYIAANFKARVMLYAACEAKNGTVQLNGLVGIPVSDAKDYYKKAFAAADIAANNNGQYSLYNVYNDGTVDGKTKNFWNLFIDESPNNKERMFVKQFDATVKPNRPENWSARQLPHGFTTQGQCGEISATVEWVELFDDIDGKPFVLDIGTSENPVRYENTIDLFAKAQPRLRATVLLPGCHFPASSLAEDIYEVRKGIYESYPGGTLHESGNFTDKWNGMTIQGRCGVGDTNSNGTGFVVWKYVDPKADGQDWAGNVDWIEMRYAEVLLNKAEAAVNIIGEVVDGHTVTLDDALVSINEIRERAGTEALTNIDEAKVINERRCELAFENQLIWDMKRWRMFEKILQNTTYHALYPYYVAGEDRYIFKKHERAEIRYTFDTKAYYGPIAADLLNRNPKLLPNNPGY